MMIHVASSGAMTIKLTAMLLPSSLLPPPDGGVADGSVGDLAGVAGAADSTGGIVVRTD